MILSIAVIKQVCIYIRPRRAIVECAPPAHLRSSLREMQTLQRGDVYVSQITRRSGGQAEKGQRMVVTLFGRLVYYQLPIISHCVMLRLFRLIAMELYVDYDVTAHLERLVTIDSNGKEEHFTVDKTAFRTGRVVGESDSMVSAHVAEGIISARIHIKGDVSVIEPASRHFPNDAGVDMFAYRGSDLNSTQHATNTYCGVTHEHVALNQSHGTDSSKARRTVPPTATTCLVSVVADSSFYQRYNQVAATVTQVMVCAQYDRSAQATH